MKKKILLLALCVLSLGTLTACGNSKLDLNDYLIESRNTLYSASDDLYTLTLSTGKREMEYNLDGIIHEMTDFSLLTFARNDGEPMANDTYTYNITIGEEVLSGAFNKSQVDNTYTIDLERAIPNDASIKAEINFTGYSFNQDLLDTTADFSVDMKTALKTANKELSEDITNILKDKNVKIEVVTKILKDYSTEDLKRYYWYVGVISTNGDTLGVLIDANSGEVIAKKV